MKIAIAIVGTVILLVFIVLLVKKSVREKIAQWFLNSPSRIWLLPALFLAYYALFTNIIGVWNPELFRRLAFYFLLPTTVLYIVGHRYGKLGWLELFIVLLMWIPVEMRWVLRGLKVAGSDFKFNYPFVVYMAIIYCLIVFTGWRKIDFQLDWEKISKKSLGLMAQFYTAMLLVIIPIAVWVGFVKFGLNSALEKYPWCPPLVLLLFLFAPALAEEVIFRGVIQNVLMDKMRPAAALIIQSLIFGLAHINNTVEAGEIVWRYPNWMYAGFAALAGFNYGYLYYKTRSMLAAVVMHAAVDFTWWLFLKGGV